MVALDDEAAALAQPLDRIVQLGGDDADQRAEDEDPAEEEHHDDELPVAGVAGDRAGVHRVQQRVDSCRITPGRLPLSPSGARLKISVMTLKTRISPSVATPSHPTSAGVPLDVVLSKA